MTTRALVIGDPHFRVGMVADMELFIEEVCAIASENTDAFDQIVVLGDVMDRHGILHQKPFHQACRFLINLAAIKPTFCLIGNHDFENPSVYLPENHPFRVMTWTGVDNLTIVDTPVIVGGVMYSPYVPPGMFARAVGDALGHPDTEPPLERPWEALLARGVGLVFAHQEFRGCQMGRLKSTGGDPWVEGPLGEGPLVISGHIHDHQTVGTHVFYTGTPIQINYGEAEKRGVCIVSVRTNPAPENPDFRWFKIRIPRKLSKTLSVDSVDAWVGKRIAELLSDYDIPPIDRRRGGDQKKEGGNIAYYHGKRETLECLLGSHLRNDRYRDHLRVHVKIHSSEALKAKKMITKLRDIPLGVYAWAVVEASPTPTPEEEMDNRTRETRSWREILETRVTEIGGGVETLYRDVVATLAMDG